MGRYFTPEEQAAGWPESFTTRQIAALQHPHRWIGSKSLYDCQLLLSELNAECAHGRLMSSKHDVPPAIPNQDQDRLKEMPIGFEKGMEIGEKFINEILGSSKKKEEVVINSVAAGDLRDWMQLEGVQPSEFIQSWFDAVLSSATPAMHVTPGNGSATTLQASAIRCKHRDLLAPLIELALYEAGNQFDTPAIWAKLCAMAEQKKKPLIGIAEDGIIWSDSNDKARFLSLNALRNRLRTKKKNMETVAGES